MAQIPFKYRLIGLAVFMYWMGVAYLLNSVIIRNFAFAGMGGVSMPPTIWLWVHWFGMTWLPILFLLGGLPTAVQALRGRDFRNTLLASIGVFSLAWVLVVAIVFWFPGLLGWHW